MVANLCLLLFPLSDLLRMNSNLPDALYYRGLSLYYGGNHPQAIAHAQSALRNDPDYVLARSVIHLAKEVPRVELTFRNPAQDIASQGQAPRLPQGGGK